MMAATSIEWCDHSVNPIRARDKRTGAVGHYCEKIAPGCAQCYASRLQSRFQMPAFGGRREALPEHIEMFLDESKLDEVRRRKKPTRYFWEDMSDLFGWWVKPEWIAKCFQAMDDTPQHTHILLTKRPYSILPMWPGEQGDGIVDVASMLPGEYPRRMPKYRPNVWLLTSIANQADADRNISLLLQCRDLVPVLGISAEPLLGPVDISKWMYPTHWHWDAKYESPHEAIAAGGWAERKPQALVSADAAFLAWVIAGGESGPGSRAMRREWALSLRDQCQSAGVPFFFKQWGDLVSCWNDDLPGDVIQQIDASVNLAGYGGPEWFRVGKKAAGRMLDGVEWSQFPQSELTMNDRKGTR